MVNHNILSESDNSNNIQSENITSETEFQKISKGGYEQFRRYLLYNKNIVFGDLGRFTITEAVAFSINCFIFPAILFQMSKTWALKKNEGFTPWFILLQLLGGAPEGGVGAIIGHLEENSQMLAIGLYAMFYNAFMLFFRIFGVTGYYPLFKGKKK
jgi:hypothetical protein